jgi:Zn-dependent protease with chaperone function
MRNFFEQQDAAQRRTSLLLGCMALAVLAMGSTVFAFAWFVRGILQMRFVRHVPSVLHDDLVLYLQCLGVTALAVAATSFVRVITLRGGGTSLAELLGARLVTGQPQDDLDRRLLNVVAEMALAAGTPVPQVYVLDGEHGINALAAGWELGDSIVCTTRGCLEKLTRAELQGVIAHEFSHILHGDARLNLRLMGTVFGMVSVGLAGRHLMRSRSREDENGLLMMLGIVLATVGAVGGGLGKLVKAAVNRQREYLADASAVQFTRHPDGIAGALKKIGGYGSCVHSARAEEAAHFFFGEVAAPDEWAWLSTHPRLADRIRRIEPGFTGAFIEPAQGIAESAEHDRMPTPRALALPAAVGVQGPALPWQGPKRLSSSVATAPSTRPAQNAANERWSTASSRRLATNQNDPHNSQLRAAPSTSLSSPRAAEAGRNNTASPAVDRPASNRSGIMSMARLNAISNRPSTPNLAELVAAIGNGRTASLEEAQAWLRRLDPELVRACESGLSACGLVFAMLIQPETATAQRQLATCQRLAGPALCAETQRLYPWLAGIARPDRLTLATLAAPTLRTLTRPQQFTLRETVAALIAEDGATSVFEHLLGHILAEQWTRSWQRQRPRRHDPLSAHLPAVQLILSALAHTGAAFHDSAAQAYEAALSRLPGVRVVLLPASPRLLSGLGPALEELRNLRPLARAAMLDASAHAVLADRRITEDEISVLRAVCLALDAPLPRLGDSET